MFIVCSNCNRFTVAKFLELAQKVGWRATIKAVSPLLFCRACKNAVPTSR